MTNKAWEVFGFLFCAFLFATSIIIIGADVRSMKETIHQTKADNCYKRYDINRNTGETYLAEDYCSNIRK